MTDETTPANDIPQSDERTALLQEALDFFTKGMLDEARQQAEDILAVYTKDLQVMTFLAIILDTQGDRAGAEEWIDKALKIDPNYAEALYYSGVFAAKDEQNQRAVEQFTLAIDNLPKDARKERSEYRCSLGAILWNMERSQEAIDAWRKAAADNPDHPLVKQYLDKCMNMYGHPKADLPELDDLGAFQKVKMDQYLRERGLRQFQDTGQIDRVADIVLETWPALSRETDWQQLDVQGRLEYFRAYPINFPD
jgi:tetratricopeptide (TPR) repeat protein